MPRVLVVEDSPTQARRLAFILEDEGFEVETVADAETAFAKLVDGGFEIVVSDLHLPGDSGFDLCRRIKDSPETKRLPIVVCTSQADPVNVLRGLQAGADGFITKGREPEEIIGCVRRALARPVEDRRAETKHVSFLGQDFAIETGREPLLDILVTAFEDVVRLNQRIELETHRSNELLRVILPDEIIAELRGTNAVKPRRREDVAVMFADIVGFTRYCEAHTPDEVVAYLQSLVEEWEEIAARHGVEKIKTIGDAMMAASGLLKKAENPVLQCVKAGVEMIAAARRSPPGWNLRVGVHAGPVVAGVLGRRQYLFDLWGDTVNEAARLESHGVAGSITLSVEAWSKIANLAIGESLGKIPVKGKGDLEIIRFVGFKDDNKI